MPRGANPLEHRRAAQQLQDKIDRISPQLIHAHFSAAIFTTALARQRDWPTTIGTYQGLIHPCQTGMRCILYRAIERWSASQMDETYVLTADDVEALRGIRRVYKQESPGFGADQSKFAPLLYPPSKRTKVRHQLGIGERDIVFIFVGRQTRFKGFPETIRGFTQTSDSACHLIVVGTPDQIHPNGLSHAELRAAFNNPRIHVIGWTDCVAKYLSASDAMIFPSQREGMSVSIMESLSMAVPVITTSARGCGDLVRDNENGLIIMKSALDVSRAMEQFASDLRLRQRLTATADSEKHLYDRNLYIQEQINIYSRLVRCTASRGD